MHRLYLSATWPGDPGAYQQALLAFGSAIKRLFIFLPLLMVACIAASSFLSPSARRRGFTIEDTISRANRVIAIDAPDKPLYRWVFTTPEDYTAVTDAGAMAKEVACSLIAYPADHVRQVTKMMCSGLSNCLIAERPHFGGQYCCFHRRSR